MSRKGKLKFGYPDPLKGKVIPAGSIIQLDDYPDIDERLFEWIEEESKPKTKSKPTKKEKKSEKNK